MINQKQPQCKNSLMGYKTIESILFHIVQIHLMQEKEMPNKNHKMVYCLNEKTNIVQVISFYTINTCFVLDKTC